jgi:F420-non-reducing hydrogenase iron-sulfur subunit
MGEENRLDNNATELGDNIMASAEIDNSDHGAIDANCSEDAKFEPKIIGFLCNWCSYAASDLAGISRIQLPTSVRIIRVMCTGSLDPRFVIEAFEQGIDGVLILGCHPGDCHYLIGNYQAEKKIKMTKQLLTKTDIEPERLHLEWVSAAEGPKFAEVVKKSTLKITSLGQNPVFIDDDPDNKKLLRLIGAKHAAGAFRLRSIVSREKTLTEDGNVYGEKIPMEKYDDWMKTFIEEEYIRSMILDSVSKEPKTVEQLAEELDIPTKTIFIHIGRLWKKQIILPVGHKDASPTYSIAQGVTNE